jgi:hypothetical protein
VKPFGLGRYDHPGDLVSSFGTLAETSTWLRVTCGLAALAGAILEGVAGIAISNESASRFLHR